MRYTHIALLKQEVIIFAENNGNRAAVLQYGISECNVAVGGKTAMRHLHPQAQERVFKGRYVAVSR